MKGKDGIDGKKHPPLQMKTNDYLIITASSDNLTKMRVKK